MAPTLYDDDAKPGDLIQISRGAFDHWAICIGGHEVVHLFPSGDDLGPFGNLGILLDSTKAKVKRQMIWEVAGDDEFKVNNYLDDQYRPRDRRRIVKEACRLVGHEMPYSIATHNCEHFVTGLRYGKPESRQVDTLAAVGGATLAGVGILALGATLFSMFSDNEDKTRQRRRHQ